MYIPDLHLPLQRILRQFFFSHFPLIVNCVLNTQSSLMSGDPQLLKYVIKLNMNKHGHMCLYVCLLCLMRTMHFPSSCFVFSWETEDNSQVKETGSISAKILLGWFYTFCLACSHIFLFFSHYLFHCDVILSSLDLLDIAATLKVLLEKRKIIGNKVNTLVGAQRCWREGKRKHHSEVTFKQHGH